MINIDKQIADWRSEGGKEKEIYELVIHQNIDFRRLSVESIRSLYAATRVCDDHDLYEQILDYLLDIYPNSTTYLRDKGLVHQKKNEWMLAHTFFTKCVELKPDAAGYNGLLATSAFMLEDYSFAAKFYQHALSLDSSNKAWWHRLARSCFKIGDLKGAERAYQELLKINEDPIIRSAYNEVLRLLHSGSTDVSDSYYDEVYTISENYKKRGSESAYGVVWNRISELLRAHQIKSILDLGCGPGQFAEHIDQNNHKVAYCGVDFSAVAVEYAKIRCPNFAFFQAKLPVDNYQVFCDFDCIVSTEVLEHIDGDIELMASFPAGKFMVGTVPNYDSFGHVRIFSNSEAVFKRYGSFFNSIVIEAIPISATNVIWLFFGLLR